QNQENIDVVLTSFNDARAGTTDGKQVVYGPDISLAPFGWIDRGGTLEPDHFLLRAAPRARQVGVYLPDPWLEWTRLPGSEPSSPDDQATPHLHDPRSDVTTWQRVRKSVLYAARLIADRANSLAPSFVRSLGRIEIELLPPALWAEEPHRLRIVFVEGDEERRDIRVIGSGVAGWVAATLRIACDELLNAKLEVFDPTTKELVTDPAAKIAIALSARHPSSLDPPGLRLAPSTNLRVLLIDEPEAHLHPAAVKSVADWLVEASTQGAVVVATHHQSLVDIPSELASLVVMSRVGGTSCDAKWVRTDRVRALESIASEVGLTKADLLLHTRLIVFVEGLHDEAVLTAMFGERLRRASVRLVPIYGTNSLGALAESDLIGALGIPMAVVTDHTDPSRVRRGEADSPEERSVVSFLDEMARRGLLVQPLGHSKRDILDHLSDDVCRSFAPDFPGWESARQTWSRDTGLDFKRWVKRAYGLKLDRDSVARIAEDCAKHGEIPPALDRLVREIEAQAGR
ncbi:MAG: ATP-dependent nuclease, partial [Acidimicrobiales bacterium]